jgi:hypothetical protein
VTQLESHSAATAAGSSVSSAATGGGGAAEGAAACVVCLETPENDCGVLPCGHVPGCAPCVRQWVARAEACPTCRRACKLHEVSYVKIGEPPPPRDAPAASAASSASAAPAASPAAASAAADAAEAVQWVDPDRAERWGTKPAAIVAHLQGALADAGRPAAYHPCPPP